MTRAVLRETFTDADGDVQAGRTVTLYEQDGTTPLTTPVYTTATGQVPASVLTTDARGELALYSNVPKRIHLAVHGRVSPVVSAFVRDTGKGALWATDYGATGDGSTDDTQALQAWLDRCISTGVDAYLPAGTYRHSGLRLTRMLVIRGAGMAASTLYLALTAGTSTDNLTVVCSSTSTRGLVLRDLALVPEGDGSGGRHGLVFDTQADGSFIANFTIDSCSFQGSVAGRAIANLVDPITDTPAVFDGAVRGCLIGGGVRLLAVADSLWWSNNLFYGENVGMELSTVAGAAKWVIRDSTFVNKGGAIWMKSRFINPSILHNYLEQPQGTMAGGSGNAALIDLDATAVGDIFHPKIVGNQFSPGNGFGVLSSIRARNVVGLVCDDNDFGIIQTGTYGLFLDAGCSQVQFRLGNVNTGGVGTLLWHGADQHALDETPDRGGQASLAYMDVVNLGSSVVGTLHIWSNGTGDAALGFLHGAGNAVSSIFATNFGGAGTGFTLGSNTGTGFAVFHNGTYYLIQNRNAATRRVFYRITGLVP